MPSGSGEIFIKYKIPEDVTITLDENYDLAITHSSEGPNLRMVQTQSCIKQTTYIKISSKSETPISKYYDVITNFRNFLSFGVGRPIYPLTIYGESEEHVSIYGNIKMCDKIDIYYNRGDLPDEIESIIPPEMFFTFKDVSELFELFIRNWFIRSEVLSPVFDLYFSSVYTPKIYTNTRFLIAVQAIESYHRRNETTKKFDVPLEEHNQRMTDIISSAPIEHRRWLSYKLKYSNEVYLSKRLIEILSHQTNTAEMYIGDRSKQTDFITKVVATRHYLTHFDKDQEAKSAKGEELLILIEKLKMIIKACLLKEIGISQSEIKTIMEKYKYQSFLRWNFISFT